MLRSFLCRMTVLRTLFDLHGLSGLHLDTILQIAILFAVKTAPTVDWRWNLIEGFYLDT